MEEGAWAGGLAGPGPHGGRRRFCVVLWSLVLPGGRRRLGPVSTAAERRPRAHASRRVAAMEPLHRLWLPAPGARPPSIHPITSAIVSAGCWACAGRKSPSLMSCTWERPRSPPLSTCGSWPSAAGRQPSPPWAIAWVGRCWAWPQTGTTWPSWCRTFRLASWWWKTWWRATAPGSGPASADWWAASFTWARARWARSSLACCSACIF